MSSIVIMLGWVSFCIIVVGWRIDVMADKIEKAIREKNHDQSIH